MTTRTLLIEYITQHPCIHFRRLVRETGLTIGQLQHHLYSLTKNNLITTFKFFRYTCYCPTGLKKEEQKILAALQHSICKEILTHISTHQENHCKDISIHINKSPSTLTYYLKRLQQENIITLTRHGKQICLHLNNKELINTFLKTHITTRLQTYTNHFIDTWGPR